MKAADIPAKFPIPFAASAGPGYTRTIPQASQIGIQDGAASLTDGFPPWCFGPSGYPWGQDENGILKQITQWTQWQNAGAAVPYDGTFSAAIGGYPKGTVLAAATFGSFWISTADDNVSDPDTGGANWLGFSPVPLYAVDGGAANALTATLAPAPASLASLVGRAVVIKKSAAPNTTAATLNLNGFGPLSIIHADGTALAASELPGSQPFTVITDGTNFILQSSASVGINPAQLQTQGGNYAADAGSANAMSITLSPAPASLAALVGVPLRIKKIAAANTTTGVTLAVNGFAATSVKYLDGSALEIGQLPASGMMTVIYDGTEFALQTNTPTVPTQGTGDYSKKIANTENVINQFISFQVAGFIPKAWCRFSASGGSVSGFSGNGVTSVVRTALGAFTVTTNVNANSGAYFINCAQSGSSPDVQGAGPAGIGAAGGYAFRFVSLANSARDPDFVCILIF